MSTIKILNEKYFVVFVLTLNTNNNIYYLLNITFNLMSLDHLLNKTWNFVIVFTQKYFNINGIIILSLQYSLNKNRL